MAKCLMTKRGSQLGGMLVAMHDESREVMTAIKENAEVMVEVKPVRNPKHHRLFWALMKLVADNFEGFDNAEHVAFAVKIACHEVDARIIPDTGEIVYEPRSLAYASMDQARFNRFFDRALYVICNRWLVGTETEVLRREVYALVDGDARTSLGERAA